MAKEVIYNIQVNASVTDLVKLNEEIEQLTKAQKELTTAKNKDNEAIEKNKQQLKALKDQYSAQSKAVQNQVKEQNNLLSIYEKESIKLNNLRKQLKDLILVEGANAQSTKKLAKEVNELDTKLKNVDASAGQFQRNVGNYEDGVKGIGTSMLGAATAATALIGGTQALIGFAKDSIAAADSQAKSEKNLQVALGFTSKALLGQADALQKSTVFQDDAIIGAQALLANLGMTEEQILKATPAILDYSTAMGVDLETAAMNVGKTMSGTIGKLGAVIPELKNLTEEQLRAGGAIDIVSAKFKGQAEAAGNVGAGGIQKLQNQYGELQEKMGFLLLNGINPLTNGNSILLDVIEDVGIGIDTLSGNFTEADKKLSVFSIVLTTFRNQFTLVWEGIKLGLLPIRVLIDFIGKLSEKFGFVSDSAKGFSNVMLDVQGVIIRLPQIISIVAGEITEAFMRLTDIAMSYGKVLKGVFTLDANAIKQGAKGIKDGFAKGFEDISKDIPTKVKALWDSPIIKDEAVKKANKTGQETGKEFSKGVSKGIQDGTKAIIGDINNQMALIQQLQKQIGEAVGEEQRRILAMQLHDAENQLKKFQEEASLQDMNFKVEIPKNDMVNLTKDLKKFNEENSPKLEITPTVTEDAKDKVKKDLTELKEASLQISQELADAEFEILNANLERQKKFAIDQLMIRDEREQDLLQAKLDKGLITQAEYENNRKALSQKTEEERIKLERDAFNKKKKLDTAQAIINGALAVTKMLAAAGPASPPLVAAAIASTAIQVATIQAQKFKRGGLIQGASHEKGGVPAIVNGKRPIEVEGGEVIINKKSASMFKKELSAINQAGGGVPIFAKGGLVPKYASGGLVKAGGETSAYDLDRQARMIINGINDKRVINVVSDTVSTYSKAKQIENSVSF